METQFDFESWSELEAKVRDIKENENAPGFRQNGIFSHLIYRGQSNAEWPLETTLDRAKPKDNSLSSYYRIAGIAKKQIETFTSRTWSDLDYAKLVIALQDYDSLVPFTTLPNYDYLVYLRHHGFPSPLLDWSRSLYIAAFFAFNNPLADKVAIFMYQEHAGAGKYDSSNEPRIIGLGPNVRSHPRHFLQQGEYTLCIQYIDGRWSIGRHSDVFNLNYKVQDKLWKLTLPANEAKTVMQKLEEYNITSFSLFQTEESLLESLARKHIPTT